MQNRKLVKREQDLSEAVSVLKNCTEIAIDTESNGLYAYRERVCLIQIATTDQCFIIDTLSIQDMSPLDNILSDQNVLKIIHGSDYDLRCLNRDYGFNLQSIFDTQIGARFLGDMRPNLGSVLDIYLGVQIKKSHKLQTSNWGLRPLSEEALEYAASDVEHLIDLHAELARRLNELDRFTWVNEECQRLEQIRYIEPAPPEVTFLNLKGSKKLNPRGLAMLKELFLWRDTKASVKDVPPSRLVTNDGLIEICLQASSIRSSDKLTIRKVLSDINRGGPIIPYAYLDDILDVLLAGIDTSEVHRPEQRRLNSFSDPESKDRLQLLKQWRKNKSASLSLDPSLIWPVKSLERIAIETHHLETEITDPQNSSVRSWQITEFATELQNLLLNYTQ